MKGSIWDACTPHIVIILSRTPGTRHSNRLVSSGLGSSWLSSTMLSVLHVLLFGSVIFPSHACAIVFLESKCGIDLHSLLSSICWLQTVISPAEIIVVIDFVT